MSMHATSLSAPTSYAVRSALANQRQARHRSARLAVLCYVVAWVMLTLYFWVTVIWFGLAVLWMLSWI
jgi:hypothetical protein